MKFKQIFCKHQWVQIGKECTYGCDGYILHMYFHMKCKKCGKQFKTRYKNFKYEIADKQIDFTHPEERARQWWNWNYK